MLHCSICCEYTSATVCCGKPTLDLSFLPIIAESQGAAIQQPTPTIDQVLAAMTAEQAAPWPTQIDAWLDQDMPIEEITRRLFAAWEADLPELQDITG